MPCLSVRGEKSWVGLNDVFELFEDVGMDAFELEENYARKKTTIVYIAFDGSKHVKK